ncbi:MAG: N-acetylmuramoyl-L-alanine amidase [Eubacterium sp.]|nr:N-acetylmuramoyl-L-alanine amidase [Candidatus Colimonas fimequi]
MKKNGVLKRLAAVTLAMAVAVSMSMASFAYAEELEGEPAGSTETKATETIQDKGEPTDPVGPTDPTDPANPTDPADSTNPTEPTEPDEPTFGAPEAKIKIVEDALVTSWAAVPDAQKYRVYRSYSLTGTKTMVKETTALKYSDNQNKSGAMTYYFVRAYDGSEWSDYSEAVSTKLFRVYLDAGHGVGKTGKFDPGCKWGKYREYKLVTPITKSMANALKRNGVYVYTDAFSGNNKSIPYAISFIKKHQVSAFVLIHCDYKKAPKGTMPLYKTSSQKALATALNKGVHSKVKIRNRGLKKRTDLMSLNANTGVPACLFETGNIKKDNKILRTKYDAYGRGLAKGLCSYLKIPYKD